MIPNLSLALCAIAAIGTVGLGLTSTSQPHPTDVFIVLFIIGPYLLLGLLVRWWRRSRPVSIAFLVLVMFLTAIALWLFGMESYQYHTDPNFKYVQRLAAFIVPLFQFFVALVVGLALLVVRFGSRWGAEQAAGRGRPDTET
jgi:hypothetical protein